MALSLHTLKPKKDAKQSKKRIGRGLASNGAKSGRGTKGQKKRAGSSGFQRLGIRQFMLATPKLRGFKSKNAPKAVVNVSDLAKHFKKGENVTPKTLLEKKLIANTSHGVKILGDGEIDIDLTVKECAVSKSAAEKILNAGGTIQA